MVVKYLNTLFFLGFSSNELILMSFYFCCILKQIQYKLMTHTINITQCSNIKHINTKSSSDLCSLSVPDVVVVNFSYI